MIIKLLLKLMWINFIQQNEQSPRDLDLDFYDASSDLLKNSQQIDFNANKLTDIDIITVNREPTSDDE